MLNTTVMDVLYRILSLPPFRNLKEDPSYGARLAMITDLIDSFTAFTEGYGLLRASSTEAGRLSFKFLMKLYYEFSGFIQTQGLNDPEDPEELIPKGFVQIMTVHQAKGLQFPIVVVGSLKDKPEVGADNWTEDFLAPFSPRKPNGAALERAQQDLVRRFYVAYSRAQNLLILCGKKGSVSSWALEASNGN
jgi:ATP-dependent exoDNAse (exonuclease V) beta subunit